jgi:hypothetical protein
MREEGLRNAEREFSPELAEIERVVDRESRRLFVVRVQRQFNANAKNYQFDELVQAVVLPAIQEVYEVDAAPETTATHVNEAVRWLQPAAYQEIQLQWADSIPFAAYECPMTTLVDSIDRINIPANGALSIVHCRSSLFSTARNATIRSHADRERPQASAAFSIFERCAAVTRNSIRSSIPDNIRKADVMKQALFVALLLLPLSAAAQQPTQAPSRSEMQSLQNEMVQQLQAKLALQAQVLDLTAQLGELRQQLAAKDAPAPAAPKKD